MIFCGPMRPFTWIPCALLLLGCPSEDGENEESGSSDPATGDPMTTADDSAALGCAADMVERDTTDGATADVQQTWGAACATDEECVALIGEGAVCLFEAVIYELPLGYCSKPCTLNGMPFVADDPNCDPAGGVDCIGNAGVGFQYCAAACTDDNQCSRDGYACRLMPMIAMEGDPTYCLMPDCCDNLEC